MNVRIFIMLVVCLLVSSCASTPRPIQPQTPSQTTPYHGLPTSVEDIEDYKIGPGDLLLISVFQVEDLSGEVRVSGAGEINLPLIGTIPVENLTRKEVKALIEQKLGERYLQNPDVTVFIKEFSSQFVTVIGLVDKPGIIPLTRPTTLLRIMALAQADEVADTEAVQLFRTDSDGEKVDYVFDFDAIQEGTAEDPYVEGGDVIVIHKHNGKAFAKWSLEALQNMLRFSPFPFLL
jgi:polysaccharide biosynthesis/export protein